MYENYIHDNKVLIGYHLIISHLSSTDIASYRRVNKIDAVIFIIEYILHNEHVFLMEQFPIHNHQQTWTTRLKLEKIRINNCKISFRTSITC